MTDLLGYVTTEGEGPRTDDRGGGAPIKYNGRFNYTLHYTCQPGVQPSIIVTLGATKFHVETLWQYAALREFNVTY